MAKRQNVVVQKARTRSEFRQGSGYSVTEIKSVGLTIKEARNKGIRVDLRRKSTYEKNIEFLMGTYSLSRQKLKIKQKPKVVKEAPKKAAPKKTTPAPKKVAPKKTTPAPKKAAPKKKTPAPKKAAPEPVEKKVTPKPEPKKTPAKPKAAPVKKKTTTKPKAAPVKKKTTTKPKAAPKKVTTKSPSKSKVPTTEEFHKMYNDETGKKAIWRGKESSVYLKWFDKKKKDLGL